MRELYSSFAEVRFIDRDAIIQNLRAVVAKAKSCYPEIAKVFLFGSFVRGDWTADSDADLIVVVDKEFPDVLARSRYQIHCVSIPTDTLVYSEAEFRQLAADPGSFLSQNLSLSMEL